MTCLVFRIDVYKTFLKYKISTLEYLHFIRVDECDVRTNLNFRVIFALQLFVRFNIKILLDLCFLFIIPIDIELFKSNYIKQKSHLLYDYF